MYEMLDQHRIFDKTLIEPLEKLKVRTSESLPVLLRVRAKEKWMKSVSPRHNVLLRWCLRGSEPTLLVCLALFAEISPLCDFRRKIRFCLHVRRASPPKRDLPIDYSRSSLGGLEIFHVNTPRRAGPPHIKQESCVQTL